MVVAKSSSLFAKGRVTRNQRLVSVVLELKYTHHNGNSLLVSKMTKIGMSCPLLSIVGIHSLLEWIISSFIDDDKDR